jgi:deoxyribodipyrimidine photolyase-related protein
LAEADPAKTVVLMIESRALASGRPHHKQKLILVFSAMRHFARTLEADGFRVDYRKSADFASGVRAPVREFSAGEIVVMEPTDFGVERDLRDAAESSEATLRGVPNELWLTDDAEFAAWADGRTSLRLEHFYRVARKRRGWLMEDGRPLGGRWNYDTENRKMPKKGHRFPDVRRFEPDELTREVRDQVEREWPGHFGSSEPFAWPVTRDDARAALQDFLDHRLALFGPFEDAMVEQEDVLYHSLLSVPLNLGLLHPREVVERALTYAAEPTNGVPLQSIEGFLRQILGWREFVRHVYRLLMPGLRQANELGHDLPLPDFYWGADTDLRCLGLAVDQLERTGHTHHIQRLMVLGNFALIARIDPRELNDWFLTTYVDALDWVVTPNVMGMSQYADLGPFTSKPYAASGKYVNRMSDYCSGCRYDPKETLGDDACPLNALYWDFIDHHLERWRANPRMALVARNWERRAPQDKLEILERASTIRAALGTSPGSWDSHVQD